MKKRTHLPWHRTVLTAGVMFALAVPGLAAPAAQAAPQTQAQPVAFTSTGAALRTAYLEHAFSEVFDTVDNKVILAQQKVQQEKAHAAKMKAQAAKKKAAKKLTVGQKAVKQGKKLQGIPYVAGGSTTAGFDCSGFTRYVYAKVGIELPHNSQAQYNACGKKVARDKLKAGDLVFFGGSTSSISHVGMYVGNGKFIHSPQTGDVVSIDDLSRRHNYVGAARPW